MVVPFSGAFGQVFYSAVYGGIAAAPLEPLLAEIMGRDHVEAIVTLCRMYSEKVYAMMRNDELSEEYLEDLREAYSVENTSFSNFKKIMKNALTNLRILEFIGKDSYPFWVDGFQRATLANTNLCNVITETSNGKERNLAIVCWVWGEHKKASVIHWIHPNLKLYAHNHKKWIDEEFVLGENVDVGNVPWLFNPLRFFDTNQKDVNLKSPETKDQQKLIEGSHGSINSIIPWFRSFFYVSDQPVRDEETKLALSEGQNKLTKISQPLMIKNEEATKEMPCETSYE